MAVATSQLEPEPVQGCRSGVGVPGRLCIWKPDLPSPVLVISQAMAFGLFWYKHSGPEIAVSLVRPVFTLELTYYQTESKLLLLVPVIQHLLWYTWDISSKR